MMVNDDDERIELLKRAKDKADLALTIWAHDGRPDSVVKTPAPEPLPPR